MVGREDKRKNNRTMLPALKKTMQLQVTRVSENIAFDRCMSTVSIGQNPNFGLVEEAYCLVLLNLGTVTIDYYIKTGGSKHDDSGVPWLG